MFQRSCSGLFEARWHEASIVLGFPQNLPINFIYSSSFHGSDMTTNSRVIGQMACCVFRSGEARSSWCSVAEFTRSRLINTTKMPRINTPTRSSETVYELCDTRTFVRPFDHVFCFIFQLQFILFLSRWVKHPNQHVMKQTESDTPSRGRTVYRPPYSASVKVSMLTHRSWIVLFNGTLASSRRGSAAPPRC